MVFSRMYFEKTRLYYFDEYCNFAGFFRNGDDGELPAPPVPSFYGVSSPAGSGKKYEEPVAAKSREFGTQVNKRWVFKLI